MHKPLMAASVGFDGNLNGILQICVIDNSGRGRTSSREIIRIILRNELSVA
jgi:hypothetical protein